MVIQRNLFDLDNARYFKKAELVSTFIPTSSFWEIFAPKNQIIIGSRGSGKTALLKMISHDHLAIFNNDKAKEILRKKLYIGVNISTKTKFVGGLKNKDWQTEKDKEYHFRWLMNIASCSALLETIKSCLNFYVADDDERLMKEIQISQKISSFWFPNSKEKFSLIHDIEENIETIRFDKSLQLLEKKIYGSQDSQVRVGVAFDLELFEPMIIGINIINKLLDLNDSTWFICIDEIEILEPFHHRILNSYMRTFNGNVFFKLTTLPYCHYTLETNTNAPLEIRHDVHYLYIDQDPSFYFKAKNYNNPALQLFRTRARISKPNYKNFDFSKLFGNSRLLDNYKINIPKKSGYYTLEELAQREPIIDLFLKLSGGKTRVRGIRLLEKNDFDKFGDEIGRKMKGLLILKSEYEYSRKGNRNETIYSGAKVVINNGDANPRKLLEIFNTMIKKYENSRLHQKHKKLEVFVDKDYFNIQNPLIPIEVQNFVLSSVAERELNKSRIEKNIGKGLFDLITQIGNYMHEYIHENELTTEQISSIDISPSIDDVTWEVIKRAVQKGLLYPNKNIHNPDEMPFKEGTFHLAYILSTKFKLLPRKGDSRALNSMISNQLKLFYDA